MSKEAKLDPVKLNDVFNNTGSQLARLLYKTKKLQLIQKQLPSMLPPHLAQEVTVMNLNATHLILQVNNGALAGALRMHHDRLLKQLNAAPLSLRLAGIKIKVRP